MSSISSSSRKNVVYCFVFQPQQFRGLVEYIRPGLTSFQKLCPGLLEAYHRNLLHLPQNMRLELFLYKDLCHQVLWAELASCQHGPLQYIATSSQCKEVVLHDSLSLSVHFKSLGITSVVFLYSKFIIQVHLDTIHT